MGSKEQEGGRKDEGKRERERAKPDLDKYFASLSVEPVMAFLSPSSLLTQYILVLLPYAQVQSRADKVK